MFAHNMKMHLIILSLLIASASFAQEIKFTNTTPWDSLAIPLDISASGRTPVFILSAGGDSFTFTEVAEDAPKANPNASVIIAYLKTRPCP